MKVSLVLFSMVLSMVWATEGEANLKPCECDAPSCNPAVLDPLSHCACLNNAEMFCWYRSNKDCAKPLRRDCKNPGAFITATSTTTGTYTAPYQGNGGLNCVEIGYCSRPTRSKTSMVVTVSGMESTIVIPVGLPTPADVGAGVDPNAGVPGITPAAPPPPTVTTPEVPVVFTPIPGADGALKRREQVEQEKKRNMNRWLG